MNKQLIEILKIRLEHWDEYHDNTEPSIIDKQLLEQCIKETESFREELNKLLSTYRPYENESGIIKFSLDTWARIMLLTDLDKPKQTSKSLKKTKYQIMSKGKE